MRDKGAIVVGVDGSDCSAAAFAAACFEARRSGSRLDVVHAWLVTEPGFPVPLSARAEVEMREQVEKALHEHVEELLASVGPLPLDEHVDYGHPGHVLTDRSRDADLAVVGSRGRGALRAAILGSVSQYLVEHAHCPVLVVRSFPADGPRRVLVGVDGSPASLDAVRWADHYARDADLPLVAVHAGAQPKARLYPLVPPLSGREDTPQLAGERLDDWLVRELGSARASDVERVVACAPAPRLLVDCAGASDMVVLGRRGHGGYDGLLLGTAARHVIAHVPGCAVVVGPGG